MRSSHPLTFLLTRPRSGAFFLHLYTSLLFIKDDIPLPANSSKNPYFPPKYRVIFSTSVHLLSSLLFIWYFRRIRELTANLQIRRLGNLKFYVSEREAFCLTMRVMRKLLFYCPCFYFFLPPNHLFNII